MARLRHRPHPRSDPRFKQKGERNSRAVGGRAGDGGVVARTTSQLPLPLPQEKSPALLALIYYVVGDSLVSWS
eukprot:COSAG02_NODE_51565_length_313_cov_0.929907_1_plen_72_part_10